MRNRLRSRGPVFAAMVFAVAIAGCAKKAPVQPPAPPPAPAPAKPTVSLQASPTSIQKGESVTLTWSSTNATELNLAPGLGRVSPEGSTRVTPDESTTYTLTATGPAGNAETTARVTVNAPPPPPTKTGPSLEELFAQSVRDAFFDYDKADIRSDARDNLTKSAEFFRAHPEVRVAIEGHCDERGSTEYNLALGDRRATAVKQFMVQLGIPTDRMDTVSFGKEKPFCTTSDETCWQQNRRGHFTMAR